ncbi:MAG: OmpA family protein [Bacteroidota bacterium]
MKKLDCSTINCFVLLFALVSLANLAHAQKNDAKGTRDHPLISRYDGFYIEKMSEVEFDAYTLPLSKAKSQNEFDKVKNLEGKIIKILYRTEKTPVPSPLQVFRNYEKALEGQGAEILFSCLEDQCGDYYTDVVTSITAQKKTLSEYLRFGKKACIIARFSKDGKEYHAGIYIRREYDNIMYEVHIIESEELETGKVSVADIESSMVETGKKAFYGIYFDFGKATIQPESKETLEQIAAFLKQNAGQAFFVVGHTDNVGSYSANLSLSEQRAAAVIKALEALQVNTSQLQAVGVGPVAPVKANDSDDNRAQNRRVELVRK